ncbi:MAG TPA: heme o synthase [Parasulfuritortus sp.]
MTTPSLALSHLPGRWRDFMKLTKPRVVMLMVFTAMIGMLLAPPGPPDPSRFLLASLGIWLAASGAAALNCLAEREIDARMARTRGRPLPSGKVNPGETLAFASILGGAGLGLLYGWVNPLTAGLTAATFFGYAVVYTRWLKPATPQNIVIGGVSGAMPPALGWAAMTGHLGHEALLLALIIYAWTPPHFWALALYRKNDYARAGLPMLPVTHGDRYTRLSIFLYILLLTGVTLLPVAVGMSGGFYLLACLLLDGYYLMLTWRLLIEGSHVLAPRAFVWSIQYLGLLFAMLLLDHYVRIPV